MEFNGNAGQSLYRVMHTRYQMVYGGMHHGAGFVDRVVKGFVGVGGGVVQAADYVVAQVVKFGHGNISLKKWEGIG